MTHGDGCHRSMWHWEASVCPEGVGKTLEEMTFDLGIKRWLGFHQVKKKGSLFQKKE